MLSLEKFLEQIPEFDEAESSKAWVEPAHFSGRQAFIDGQFLRYSQDKARMLVMAAIINTILSNCPLCGGTGGYEVGTGGSCEYGFEETTVEQYQACDHIQSKITAILHKHAETSDDKGGEG